MMRIRLTGKRIALAAGILLAFAFAAGCHNTGRQVRKTVDSIHDVFLEGSQ